MALASREKIKENVQPLLEPGEQVQAVIPAQTKSGWLGAIGLIWLVIFSRYQPIVVTDRRILITDSGRWSQGNPKSIVSTVARSTQIGPPSGLWWKCDTLGTRLYINKRFHKDVTEADSKRSAA